MLIVGLTFAVVFGIVVGAYAVFVAIPERRDHARLRGRLRDRGPAPLSRGPLLKGPEKLSSIEPLHELLTRIEGPIEPVKRALDESGLTLQLGPFLLLSLATCFLVILLVDRWLNLPWLAILLGVGAGIGPYWGLRFARERRIAGFEEQFPEAVELIARALRAGHAFTTGLQMAADELPPPAGPEFRLLYERQNYGADLPQALRLFADRIPSLDARFFVTAVLTQREAGGNLSEVLDRLAAVMRERFRIRREVRVKSAHGRITAYVLAGMPPALAGLLFINNPDQLRLLLDDPLGVRMIAGGVALEVLGVLIVRRLVDIRY